jgi:CheY-like chemotaxis protein
LARILIMDDEPVIVMILEEILRDAGHDVLTALNGNSGLEILERTAKPDLVLMDLLMPGMGGKDFLQVIKANPQFKDIPVILITGSVPDLKTFPATGSYQSIICKPFDIDQVVEKVNHLLLTGPTTLPK